MSDVFEFILFTGLVPSFKKILHFNLDFNQFLLDSDISSRNTFLQVLITVTIRYKITEERIKPYLSLSYSIYDTSSQSPFNFRSAFAQLKMFCAKRGSAFRFHRCGSRNRISRNHKKKVGINTKQLSSVN